MKKKYRICMFFICSFICALYAVSTEIPVGDIKLVLYDDMGSFALYYLSDIAKNRYEPLLSDRNFSRNSAFFIDIDGKTLKLQKSFNVQLKTEKMDNGARFTFTIPNYYDVPVEVIQDFILFSSKGSLLPQDIDTLRVETSIIPSKNVFRSYSIRAVLDTHLGENEGVHFSSNNLDRISSEMYIIPDENNTWVLSSGKTAQMRILYGDDGIFETKEPNEVVIANRERVYNADWMLRPVAGRNFNSTYGINDSAVGLYWGNTNTASFYITVSPAGLEPAKKITLDGSKTLPLPVILQSVTEVQPAVSSKNTVSQVPVDTNAVNIVTSSVPSDMHIDEATRKYIENILKRIDELSAAPDKADSAEIQRLSKELDAIMHNFKIEY